MCGFSNSHHPRLRRTLGRFFVCLLFFPVKMWAAAFAPVALVPWDEKTILVLGEASRSLCAVDVESGNVARTLSLPAAPSGIALAGDTAYITAGSPIGHLLRVDLKKWELAGNTALGHTPMSPVMVGDDLYVTERFLNQVLRLDPKTGEILERLDAVREPVAIAISPRDRALWAANLLPQGRADAEHVAAQICVFFEGKRQCISLPNGSHSVRSAVFSPDGKYALFPHLVSRYALPTTQVDKGWINTNAVTIFDAIGRRRLYTFLLDDIALGAANPWGICFSPDGNSLYISHAGTQELSVIDFPKLLKRLAETDPAAVEEKLGFISDIRLRVPLGIEGARAIAYADNRVFVLGYFSDEIAVYTPSTGAVARFRLGDGLENASERRRGEAHFNDARLCFQQWQSCASCHPDTRMDALNWDLLNDGVGNAKNTKSLVLSHRTPPVMALGSRQNAEAAVRTGFRYIQFVVPEEKTAEEVDAYLRDLPPLPSPFLNYRQPSELNVRRASCALCHDKRLQRGTLTPLAKEGKAVFQKAGCVRCHPHPYFTDGNAYDVGTLTGQDKGKKLDTPTLIEIWRTAPYLHDGSAATLEDVVFERNQDGQRGQTQSLTPVEKAALIEYLKSL